MSEVRNMDRHFPGDDAALLRRRLLLVATGDVHPLHYRPVVARVNLEHIALLALVLAGDDDDAVTLPDLELDRHHSTSGASEMIFTWFFALSSRGTGPKM